VKETSTHGRAQRLSTSAQPPKAREVPSGRQSRVADFVEDMYEPSFALTTKFGVFKISTTTITANELIREGPKRINTYVKNLVKNNLRRKDSVLRCRDKL
jgi:hypothetical protein